MRNFKDLIVWQKSIELAIFVCEASSRFPAEEKYGLANQVRRAVISIPSNIAEGHMRSTAKDFRQFLAIALGSCAELETQIIIAHKLKYIGDDTDYMIGTKLEEVSKMLASFRLKLKNQL